MSQVGQVLKTWRRHRRMSQLDLSCATGVTSRHISFVETGRSVPSRALLERLADALDMPLRNRNELHLAAGFAPPYRELSFDDAGLADATAAVEAILTSHEPRPAIVMDGHWDLVRANEGARRLFGSMIDLAALPSPANILEAMFDPAGLRPYVLDWDQVALTLLARAQREATGGVPDPALTGRIERLSRSLLAELAPTVAAGPLVPIGFRVDGVDLRFFSTITTIGTPLDVTLQELRIEQFHPAGEAARAWCGL